MSHKIGKVSIDMETKDWIILLLPIFSNGLLIWMFQYFINRRQDRSDRYHTLREEIFRTYLQKVETTIRSYSAFSVAASSLASNQLKENRDELNSSYAALVRDALEVWEYFKMYEVVLSTSAQVAQAHRDLNDTFERWVLSDDMSVALSLCKNCEDLLRRVMKLTLEHIYGVR